MISTIQKIEGFSKAILVEHILSGWSLEDKYHIRVDGDDYLIRFQKIDYLERFETMYERMHQFDSDYAILSKALHVGTIDTFSYIITSFIPGIPLASHLKTLTNEQQYQLGINTGYVLSELQSVDSIPFQTDTMIEKINLTLNRYRNHRLRITNDTNILDFISENLSVLKQHDFVLTHNDYHHGNLVWTPTHHLGVIDFNRCKYEHPYQFIEKVQMFDAEIAPFYASGIIDGFFDFDIPNDFWNTAKVIIAFSSINSILWAESFGSNEVKTMQYHAMRSTADFNNYTSETPRWYKGIMNTCQSNNF